MLTRIRQTAQKKGYETTLAIKICCHNRERRYSKFSCKNRLILSQVAVTSVQYDVQPCRLVLFCNYNAASSAFPHRNTTAKLWEAARATSAAPTYFSHFELKVGNHTHFYVDGGLAANNPSLIAYSEAITLWGASAITCVVSIGTGVSP